ncbi:MAG: hypothetical protein ACI9FG_000501 [Crocinitomicaceae bacterium]|jgi:hypothetical protein
MAVTACISLSSCETLGRTMQVPGNLLHSVGRSAGLASHEDAAPSEFECALDPEFD